MESLINQKPVNALISTANPLCVLQPESYWRRLLIEKSLIYFILIYNFFFRYPFDSSTFGMLCWALDWRVQCRQLSNC